jgi:hypothetical protein
VGAYFLPVCSVEVYAEMAGERGYLVLKELG